MPIYERKGGYVEAPFLERLFLQIFISSEAWNRIKHCLWKSRYYGTGMCIFRDLAAKYTSHI
jgi:hypothetical protein